MTQPNYFTADLQAFFTKEKQEICMCNSLYGISFRVEKEERRFERNQLLSRLYLHKTKTQKVQFYLQERRSARELPTVLPASTDGPDQVYTVTLHLELPFPFISFPCSPNSPGSSIFNAQYATDPFQTCWGRCRISVQENEATLHVGEVASHLQLCGNINVSR